MTHSKTAWPGFGLAKTRILIACLFLLPSASMAALAEPTINSILVNRSNILVKVTAPIGVRKVMLESRSRAEGSVWSPRAVHRFDAAVTSATELSFEVANAEQLEVIRVRADDAESFSAQFFSGQSAFTESVVEIAANDGTTTGSSTTSGGTSTGTTSGATTGPVPAPGPSASNMWKVDGDTLYYFNQNRGLQIIDLANPAALSLRASYPLAGRGDQMHVLSNGTVLLLAQPPCSSPGFEQTKVIALNTAVSPIAKLSEQTLDGYIAHTSVLGNYLYTVSTIYRPGPTTNATGQVWEQTIEINSFDLSNPAAPVRRATLSETGPAGVVSISDRFLFLAFYGRPGAPGPDLQIYDLAGADGAVRRCANIPLSGYIRDPDKIRFQDGVLTLVHQRMVIDNAWTAHTESKLVNYSLANPDSPALLGELDLPTAKEFTASRFDGNRFYVETFREDYTSPVVIVDLSNPAQPRLAGEVAMPGWITILHPLVNRLLAVGIDNTAGQKVVVALFDVTDPAVASLRSRASMGEGTNYSYSAALYDPDAWTILPRQNLIFAPWSGRPGPDGTAGLLDIIDFESFNLNTRSTVTAGYDPRRSVLHRGHLITVSSGELFSFDLSDHSNPVVKSKLSLAWPVDKVLLVGDHLLEIETGVRTTAPHFDNHRVSLRVARADAPDTALTTQTFDPLLPIAGGRNQRWKTLSRPNSRRDLDQHRNRHLCFEHLGSERSPDVAKNFRTTTQHP
jgi:hypothetical protein